MDKNEEARKNPGFKLAVNTDGLQYILSCGKPCAVATGKLAHAECRIGGRVLWNVAKVQAY